MKLTDQDLILRFRFVDRGGRNVYEIAQPTLDENASVVIDHNIIGSLRLHLTDPNVPT